MAYIPTEWHDGDIVTAELLNKIEDGIANMSGGGLKVTFTIDNDSQEETDVVTTDVPFDDIVQAAKDGVFIWSVASMPNLSLSHIVYYGQPQFGGVSQGESEGYGITVHFKWEVLNTNFDGGTAVYFIVGSKYPNESATWRINRMQ